MEAIREVEATLIGIHFVEYMNHALGKGIPVDQSFYEATFLIEDTKEKILFQLSALEASVLEVNETGKLKFKANKYNNVLISFADKLKEVMNS